MSEYIIDMQNIVKEFPGVLALDGVNLKVKPGEIHALLGENGAGKSTLMNVLLGVYRRESGVILYGGKELKVKSPTEALRQGIAMVPQELNLIPEATIAENIFLGNERRRGNGGKGIIAWKKAREEAEKLLDELGLTVDVEKKVAHLSASYQQLILIARSIAYKPKVLILDEPTSALTMAEADLLFAAMNRLKKEGTSMIFITHHLDEVMKEADSITIMRDGKTVHSCAKNDITTEKIISYMANRDVMRRKKSKRKVGNEIFIKAEHFSREDEYEDASFEVRKGEILCVAGLIGAGRTELFKTVFGLNKPKPGAELIIEGKKVNLKSHSPRESIRMGIGYVPEERRMMGIFPVLSVSENMMMPSYRQLTKNMAIQYREVEKQTEKYVKSMSIKTPSSAAQIRNLSGGNQQKVIVARWMAKGVKMLILDEPTRGIDVNAKDEIHNLITELADNGVTVVVISSEMEEVLALADRIMIMHDGQIKGFINETEGILEEDILKIALKGVIQ